MFWYNRTTYGVNLADPDIDFFPSIIKEHNNMSELETALTDRSGSALFDKVYDQLDAALNFMIDAMPDKLATSEFGDTENMLFGRAN